MIISSTAIGIRVLGDYPARLSYENLHHRLRVFHCSEGSSKKINSIFDEYKRTEIDMK